MITSIPGETRPRSRVRIEVGKRYAYWAVQLIMVRLGTRFAVVALWAATLLFVVRANAQWQMAPALQQQQTEAQQPQPPPPEQQQQATPSQHTTPEQQQTPPSSGPLHWHAQGNTVQPVTQNPQQPTATASVPRPTTPAPGSQGTPQARMQQTAPTSAPQPAGPAAKPTTTPTAHRRTSRTGKTQVAEVPPAPAPPPTLDQQPPTPPLVRFQNGELTIEAQNSTLAQVLRAVQTQTGASIDVPGGANSERVATKIGPGQPRDVLNTLLNGSKFDYVILGVMGKPGAVQKVILTPRQSGAVGTTTAQNNSAPRAPEAEADENVAESEPEQNERPQPPVPPGGFRRPGGPGFPGAQASPPDQNAFTPGDTSNNGNGAKSPEQLMQELQQMQQQQQQLQEQLNPANRQPPQ